MNVFLKKILIKIAVYIIELIIKNNEDVAANSLLRDKQTLFLNDIGKLIEFSQTLPGYELTAGEMYRPPEMQAIYLSKGLTKVRYSKHTDRLAFDINVFINGERRTDKEAYKPLAEFWASLSPENNSGYYWGWDYNHFQRS